MIVVRVKEGIVSHFAGRFPEWLFAFIMINIGQALVGSGNTFATSHSYDGMAAIASESVWGWSMMALASVRLFCLGVNGSFEWFKAFSPGARVASSFLSIFAWFFIFSGMLYANPIGTGARAYGSIMLGEMVVAIMISGEAGHAFWPWWKRRKAKGNGRD